MLESYRKSSAESIPFFIGGKFTLILGSLVETVMIKSCFQIDIGRSNTPEYIVILSSVVALLGLRNFEELKHKGMLIKPEDYGVNEGEIPSGLPLLGDNITLEPTSFSSIPYPTAPEDMYLYMPPAASPSTDL